MLLIDTNILVYAYRQDSFRHMEFRRWVEQMVSSGQTFSIPEMIGSSFLRIVTNPRIYRLPTPFEEALTVLDDLTRSPNHVANHPGKNHWAIFIDLCRKADVKGDLVPDAYLAALAIEIGGEWITADKDYSKFPGLNWRHPLDGLYKPGKGSGSFSVQEPRRRYRSRIRTASLVK